MSTQPSPSLLIRRVCDALQASAVDPADPVLAQRQIKAALWALRRIAQGLQGRDERLRADIADMQQVLTDHADVLPADAAAPPASDEARHRHGQARVAELEALAFSPGTAASQRVETITRDLHALYRRMLDRESGEDDGDQP